MKSTGTCRTCTVEIMISQERPTSWVQNRGLLWWHIKGMPFSALPWVCGLFTILMAQLTYLNSISTWLWVMSSLSAMPLSLSPRWVKQAPCHSWLQTPTKGVSPWSSLFSCALVNTIIALLCSCGLHVNTVAVKGHHASSKDDDSLKWSLSGAAIFHLTGPTHKESKAAPSSCTRLVKRGGGAKVLIWGKGQNIGDSRVRGSGRAVISIMLKRLPSFFL